MDFIIIALSKSAQGQKCLNKFMKQFLKNNWFKLIMALGIVLASVAIGYYFFIYLPKESVVKLELENQRKCQQDGFALYNSQLKEQGSGNFGNPEFKFNKELKTCLYKNVYLMKDYANYFMIDVYTNKEIVSWIQLEVDGRPKDQLGSQQEWESEVKRLFE